MTGSTPGASSDPTWTAAELAKAQGIVRRLQTRIVQAVRAGRWHKVKALQHLLTHSRSAKILAVRRVTENAGNHTPGVDGVTWKTPALQQDAVTALQRRGYRPLPLRRCYIPKSNGRLRPLGIPAMKDRAMQALYLQALDPVAETLGDPHSYGFRPARSCADALERAHHLLALRGAPEWVLEGDIQACFDRINHAWLLEHVPLDRQLLRLWLEAGYMERARWYPTQAGTPQGGIISPVLANLALDGLQKRLTQAFPKAQGRNPKVHLVRYADDFLITGSSRELLEQQVRPLVAAFLAERGLVLSPEKTVITHVADGFDFLGQHVQRFGRKVLSKPAAKSVKTCYQNLRALVKANLNADPATLVRLLNPRIQGWAMYHRHASSKATFQKLDSLLFRLVWNWAKHRHSNKSGHWLRDRYFTTVRGDHWVFFGWEARARGEPRKQTLVKAGGIRIRRHIKVCGNLNAYAPEWADYLARRRNHRHARECAALAGTAATETAQLWE